MSRHRASQNTLAFANDSGELHFPPGQRPLPSTQTADISQLSFTLSEWHK